MSIYAAVDAAADEIVTAVHTLVPVVAQQANVPETDALYHLRRTLLDRLKAIKLSDRADYADDGRAAAWRVRLMIWAVDGGEDSASCVADSDPDQPFGPSHVAPGQTVIHGLPAVARWALELITSYHAGADAGCAIDGLSEGILVNKLRSVRVALSNGAGDTVWRLRYTVRGVDGPQEPHTPGSLRGIRRRVADAHHYRADVRILKEEVARRQRR